MLTARQQDTLEFIRRFMTEKNLAPTEAEIAKGIGITSRGVVHRYVSALEQAGFIKTVPSKRRNIRLRHNYKNHVLGLPLMGRLLEHHPIKSVEDHDVFNITSELLKPNRFLLQMGDDHLRSAGIFSGDFIVCELQHEAHHGDIVIAIVDDTTLLRTLQWNGDGTITLSFPFTQQKPMVYDSARIKVHALYRGLFRLGEL